MSSVFCANVVEDVIEADDYNWQSKSSVSWNNDSRPALSSQLQLISSGEEIHQRFDKLRCSQSTIDKLMESHYCESSSRFTREPEEPFVDSSVVNSTQQTTEYNKLPSITRSVMYIPVRKKISRDFSSSSPNINYNFSNRSDLYQESVIDDNTSRVLSPSGILSPRSIDSKSSRDFTNSSTSMNRNDRDLYKSVLSCILHPLLPIIDSSEVKEISEEAETLRFDTTTNKKRKLSRKTEKKMEHARRVFGVDSENHKVYVAQHRRKSGRSVIHQLRREMKLIEKNEHSYYLPEFFQNPKKYAEWREEELNVIPEMLKLLQVQFPEQVQAEEDESFVRARDADFETLVDKIIEHQRDFLTPNDKHSSSLTVTTVPESVASSSDAMREDLISKTSREILIEFSLRSRLTPITQRVIIIERIVRATTNGTINLGDAPVLQELLRQCKNILNLLGETRETILINEEDTLKQTIDEITKDLKNLLNTFLSSWKPTQHQLEQALELLVTCFRIKIHDSDISRIEAESCISLLFRNAIEKNFEHKFCRGGADCKPCVILLQSVLFAISSIEEAGTEIFQRIFNLYMEEEVVTTMAEILFKRVIALATSLSENPDFSNNNIQTQIILASKLAELEGCVLEAGYKPAKDDDNDVFLLWRRVFDQMTPNWIDFATAEEGNTGLVKACVRHNKRVKIEMSSNSESSRRIKIYEPLIKSKSSTKMVTTRVHPQDDEVLDQPHHQTDAEDQTQSDLEETERRFVMNTLVGPAPGLIFEDSSLRETTDLTRTDPEPRVSELTSRCSDIRSSSESDSSTIYEDPEWVFNCTQSIFDFIILLNRMSKFLEEVAKFLYELPEELSDKVSFRKFVAERKVNFSQHVIKTVSNLINQFTSCMLNLDVCVFPKKIIHDYVTKVKLNELYRRANKGLIDCCRHQLTGNQQCVDDVTHATQFEEGGAYFMMALRINNIAILHHGLHHIWNSLANISGEELLAPSVSPTVTLLETSKSNEITNDSSMSENPIDSIDNHNRSNHQTDNHRCVSCDADLDGGDNPGKQETIHGSEKDDSTNEETVHEDKEDVPPCQEYLPEDEMDAVSEDIDHNGEVNAVNLETAHKLEDDDTKKNNNSKIGKYAVDEEAMDETNDDTANEETVCYPEEDSVIKSIDETAEEEEEANQQIVHKAEVEAVSVDKEDPSVFQETIRKVEEDASQDCLYKNEDNVANKNLASKTEENFVNEQNDHTFEEDTSLSQENVYKVENERVHYDVDNDNRNNRNHADNIATENQSYPLSLNIRTTGNFISSITEETESDVTRTLKSLSGILAWRISKRMIELLKNLLETSNQFPFLPFLAKSDLKEEMRIYQEHSNPFVEELRRSVKFLSQWTEDCVTHECKKALGKIIVKYLRKNVNCSTVTGSKLSQARLLLFLFNSTFKIIGIDDIISDDVEPILTVLNLYVLPTNEVIELYYTVEEENQPSFRDNFNTIRRVSRQQKLFSGNELIQRFVCTMGLDEDCPEDKLTAEVLCKKLLEEGMIELVWKKQPKIRLPGLVECTEELTKSVDFDAQCSSVDIRTEGSSEMISSNEYISEPDGSCSRSSESEGTCFVSDDYHYYSFVSKPSQKSKISFYQLQASCLSNMEGDDIDGEFLRRIIQARRHYDEVARKFTRKYRSKQKWFFPCSCMT